MKYFFLAAWAWLLYSLGAANSGRHTDPWPVKCEECGHVGQRRSMVHGYTFHDDEAEPQDECPKCGSEI